MSAVMVRYTMKPDHAEVNRQLVEALFDELQETRPQRMRYSVFLLDDGASFVHVYWSEREDGSSPLTELASFKRFQEGFADRAQEGPTVTQLREVGLYPEPLPNP